MGADVLKEEEDNGAVCAKPTVGTIAANSNAVNKCFMRVRGTCGFLQNSATSGLRMNAIHTKDPHDLLDKSHGSFTPFKARKQEGQSLI